MCTCHALHTGCQKLAEERERLGWDIDVIKGRIIAKVSQDNFFSLTEYVNSLSKIHV